MKGQIKRACASIVCILVTLSAYSQENSSDQMKKLNFLISDWKVIETSGSVASLDTTRASIKWLHEGKFVQELVQHKTQFGEINMLTIIGFDSRWGKYKLTAMDKEYGMMDTYEGDWQGGQLIFTNLNSDKAISMEDGKQLNFRLTYYDIESNSYYHKVEGTYDRGETWFTFSISQYLKG